MGDSNEKSFTSILQENNRFTANKGNKFETKKQNGYKRATPHPKKLERAKIQMYIIKKITQMFMITIK